MADLRYRIIARDDLQLLRYWRNQDHVRSGMVNQAPITHDGQRNWFESLDKDRNEHFIYSMGEADVGSVNLAKIDRCNGTFEAGVYCGNRDFLGHMVNVAACIFIYDRAFETHGLRTSGAIIRDNNRPALSLNRSLGYERTGDCGEGIGRYELTAERYLTRRSGLNRYMKAQLGS